MALLLAVTVTVQQEFWLFSGSNVGFAPMLFRLPRVVSNTHRTAIL